MRKRHPFYIVAPGYDEASAGNRVLYGLAVELQRLGYEAFMTSHEQFAPTRGAPPAHLNIRYLTPTLARTHFAEGRTPITIYPEVSRELSTAGIRVFYLLNYIGAMGGPDEVPECEQVIAYSQNIARTCRATRHIIFIPVSDPDYWVQDPSAVRDIRTAYAGKYVEEYGQALPAEVGDATVITRHQPNAPTRPMIRALLQRSECFYVYENTALATEAALCGCPVVYRTNPYFPNWIAEHELGLDGFTTVDTIEALAHARSRLREFRRRYLKARASLGSTVKTFALESQLLAQRKRYVVPFPVRDVD